MKWIRNTPTSTREWHDLKVQIAGPKVTAYLDGKLYLEHALPEPISGPCRKLNLARFGELAGIAEEIE